MLWSKLRSLLTEYVFFFPSSFSSFAPSLPQKKKNNNNKQFDALIERSLHLISRLRLGEIREVNSSDGTVTLRPDNVVDMDLFLNLCTFLDCLLPLRVDPMDRSRFSRWIPTLCETVVAVAMRPSCHNVSGFYRLLTIAMRNGDRDNFFRPGASTTVRCREILRPFLQGIQRRMYAHTDEYTVAHGHSLEPETANVLFVFQGHLNYSLPSCRLRVPWGPGTATNCKVPGAWLSECFQSVCLRIISRAAARAAPLPATHSLAAPRLSSPAPMPPACGYAPAPHADGQSTA